MFKMLRRLVVEMVATSPGKVVGSILLTVALSLTEGAGLLLLIPLLGLVGIGQNAGAPRAAEWLQALFARFHVTPTLSGVLVLFVAIAGLRSLLQRSQLRLNAAVREDITEAMRSRLYQAIVGAEWKFLVTRRPSEFAHVLAGEIGRVGSTAEQIIDVGAAMVISMVYIGLAFRLSPPLASFVLLCALALSWTLLRALDKARQLGRVASNARRKLSVAISEHMGSIKTTKSYGLTKHNADKFLLLSGNLRGASLNLTLGETEFQQKLEFVSTALLAIIVYISFTILKVTTAQLLVLLYLFARLMPRLVSIYQRAQMLTGSLPVFDTVAKLESACLDAAEPPIAGTAKLSLNKSIRLDSVSFAYVGNRIPAVHDISLEIALGCTTAFVGPSGSGKSTLADMLVGLLTPTAGSICIDDAPLIAEQLNGWRTLISYVPQDTFLFHDTVRANLLWTRPEARDDELWQALHLSAADEFVMRLPHGLDTVLGERGVLVSGGERQRLSLARALVRRPEILVLDEATSSLDSENELRIQRAIDGLQHRMTIVVITHRLSTIRHADTIHVLDRGRIVESGSWDQLISYRGGRFSELCHSQGIIHEPTYSPDGRAVESASQPLVIHHRPTSVIAAER
jgi:ATP-binding cassette subfamily C protein